MNIKNAQAQHRAACESVLSIRSSIQFKPIKDIKTRKIIDGLLKAHEQSLAYINALEQRQAVRDNNQEHAAQVYPL